MYRFLLRNMNLDYSTVNETKTEACVFLERSEEEEEEAGGGKKQKQPSGV